MPKLSVLSEVKATDWRAGGGRFHVRLEGGRATKPSRTPITKLHCRGGGAI